LVFSVLNYIDTRYRTGTLAEVSAELGQPTYTVSRLLKKHMGSNFRELLQSRKLQQAAYLLDNTTLSADAIMERVGYDNSSYFYRKFRERYGCSPREYRKQH
ncbi:MAG: helix-turn-helix transcriptional regulator, partial [Clostridiales bacterium]|nr:helix-turn-helix transcriptional regulator [Clostridiales bacterium]